MTCRRTFDKLDKLNEYFGSKNLIQRIRTKFAFHSDTESVALAYSSLPSVFKSVEYLSEYVGHTLFHTSETVGFIAIVGVRKDNWQEALDQIIQEITEIFFIFEIFITGFFNIIYKRHLAPGGQLRLDPRNPRRSPHGSAGRCQQAFGGQLFLGKQAVETGCKVRAALDYGSCPLLQIGLHLFGRRVGRLPQHDVVHDGL